MLVFTCSSRVRVRLPGSWFEVRPASDLEALHSVLLLEGCGTTWIRTANQNTLFSIEAYHPLNVSM